MNFKGFGGSLRAKEIVRKISKASNIPYKKLKFYNFMRTGFSKDCDQVFDEIRNFLETSGGSKKGYSIKTE